MGAYNILARIYLQMRDYPQMIAISQRAIEVDPEYGHAYNNLGLAFNETGRYQEAVEAYEQAIRLLPGNATIIQNFTAACRNLGRIAPAAR